MIADTKHNTLTVEEVQQVLRERPDIFRILKLYTELSADGKKELLKYARELQERKSLRNEQG